MQFQKLERLLEKKNISTRLQSQMKSLKKNTPKRIHQINGSYFNTVTSSSVRSTGLLKTQIQSFMNERKIMGKNKRCITTDQSLDTYFSKSKVKRKEITSQKNNMMNKSTIPDLKKYVDILQQLGKLNKTESNRSPSKLNNSKTLSDIKLINITMDTECKESVSTLEITSQFDKNKSSQVLPDHTKEIQVEDFDLIKNIGDGKFSEVYLVKHRKTQFHCALKIIRKSQLNSVKMVNQFVREIKIHSHVKHPNIINLYSSFCDDGNVYLLQQYGSGGQLYKKLKSVGSFSEKTVSFIIRNVIEAVKYLHQRKILHRDIKPQNIVLVEGIVKICDFGWAVYEPNKLRQTLCGTPLYTCPELVKGQKYSNKIDLWTIGMLTFQLFFGHIPFRIQQQDDLARIATDQISFPPNSKCSSELQDFILQLLKKDPRQRLTAQIMLLHPFIQKYNKVQVCQELFS